MKRGATSECGRESKEELCSCTQGTSLRQRCSPPSGPPRCHSSTSTTPRCASRSTYSRSPCGGSSCCRGSARQRRTSWRGTGGTLTGSACRWSCRGAASTCASPGCSLSMPTHPLHSCRASSMALAQVTLSSSRQSSRHCAPSTRPQTTSSGRSPPLLMQAPALLRYSVEWRHPTGMGWAERKGRRRGRPRQGQWQPRCSTACTACTRPSCWPSACSACGRPFWRREAPAAMQAQCRQSSAEREVRYMEGI
mmetsp:Transcript_15832/g.61864  ORF Transcript_15832/g.61864 Transcript_15832/m.61864 type:complete len:251 (-) Transcript_15832:8-760(-)